MMNSGILFTDLWMTFRVSEISREYQPHEGHVKSKTRLLIASCKPSVANLQLSV